MGLFPSLDSVFGTLFELRRTLGTFALCFESLFVTHFRTYFHRKLIIEKHDALLAVEPFIQAERDRAFLKQLIKLRQDETELMANKPGWVVGTLYGEQLAVTDPSDTIPNFPLHEYYVHRHPWELYNWVWPDRLD